MAGLFSRRYEPSPRYCHFTATIGGKTFLWGGSTKDFSEKNREKLSSVVETFDPYLEQWEQQATKGAPPPGLCNGACTSLMGSLFICAGTDGTNSTRSLHQLDTATLQWKKQPQQNPHDGPMRKVGCGMVSYNDDTLALFGGYGIPGSALQSGSQFIKNQSSSGRGWTNEFHVFNIMEGQWSSPFTTGTRPRPPPCSGFSFNKINRHRAVLFGGSVSTTRQNNDIYIIDFQTMHWTKVQRPAGIRWPKERSYHAACCLNYGQEHPQLLISGGLDSDFNSLSDMWLYDVDSKRWRQLSLPEDVPSARVWHSLTAVSLAPGLTEVTMFGGCPKIDPKLSEDKQGKIAGSTVLTLESVEISPVEGRPNKEWILVSVARGKQLGSTERIGARMAQMRQKMALHDIRVTEERVMRAEREARDATDALQRVQHSQQEAQQQLQEAQIQIEERDQQIQERDLQIEEEQQRKDQQIEEQDQHIQEIEHQIAQKDQQIEERDQHIQEMQHQIAQKDQQFREAQQRAQLAENRLEEAERRLLPGRQEEEPLWVVQRGEIELAEEEEELGRGGWGVVKVATFRGAHVAAKFLHGMIVSSYNRTLFVREITLASRVRHPNLLQFIGATLEGELVFLTELMSTNLRAVLEERAAKRQTVSHGEVITVSQDVARALNYLHLMKPDPIIHRDISSANVLLEPTPNNSWRAKVSDYGSANFLRQLRTAGPGNPFYAAPEANQPDQQSTKMDIFSFGILLVEMATCCFPDASSRERHIGSIRHPELVTLIRQCLSVDRDRRPSARELLAQLSACV